MLIDEYYKSLKKQGLNKAVVVPEEMMIKNSEDDEGWVEWKLVKSQVNTQEIKEIENRYKIHLPEDYCGFIMEKQFLDMQISNYTIHGINSLNTLDKEASLLPRSILEKGFFPIGNIDDADYIALDTTNNKIVQLSFENYNIRDVLSENFTNFLIFLDKFLRKG